MKTTFNILCLVALVALAFFCSPRKPGVVEAQQKAVPVGPKPLTELEFVKLQNDLLRKKIVKLEEKIEECCAPVIPQLTPAQAERDNQKKTLPALPSATKSKATSTRSYVTYRRRFFGRRCNGFFCR